MEASSPSCTRWPNSRSASDPGVSRVGLRWENTLLDQVESDRFFSRFERDANVSRVGGGGKDGGTTSASLAMATGGSDDERCKCSNSVSIAVTRVSSMYKLGSAFTGPECTHSVLFTRSNARSGVVPFVSGAAITIWDGLSALGDIWMGKVVDALSSKVGWMRKYLPESLSQSRFEASFCWAREMASAWRRELSVRFRRWVTAMEEDWSRAIISARAGKMVARRGEVAVGMNRVVLQMGIVGVGWRGWVLSVVLGLVHLS